MNRIQQVRQQYLPQQFPRQVPKQFVPQRALAVAKSHRDKCSCRNPSANTWKKLLIIWIFIAFSLRISACLLPLPPNLYRTWLVQEGNNYIGTTSICGGNNPLTDCKLSFVFIVMHVFTKASEIEISWQKLGNFTTVSLAAWCYINFILGLISVRAPEPVQAKHHGPIYGLRKLWFKIRGALFRLSNEKFPMLKLLFFPWSWFFFATVFYLLTAVLYFILVHKVTGQAEGQGQLNWIMFVVEVATVLAWGVLIRLFWREKDDMGFRDFRHKFWHGSLFPACCKGGRIDDKAAAARSDTIGTDKNPGISPEKQPLYSNSNASSGILSRVSLVADLVLLRWGSRRNKSRGGSESSQVPNGGPPQFGGEPGVPVMAWVQGAETAGRPPAGVSPGTNPNLAFPNSMNQMGANGVPGPFPLTGNHGSRQMGPAGNNPQNLAPGLPPFQQDPSFSEGMSGTPGFRRPQPHDPQNLQGQPDNGDPSQLHNAGEPMPPPPGIQPGVSTQQGPPPRMDQQRQASLNATPNSNAPNLPGNQFPGMMGPGEFNRKTGTFGMPMASNGPSRVGNQFLGMEPGNFNAATGTFGAPPGQQSMSMQNSNRPPQMPLVPDGGNPMQTSQPAPGQRLYANHTTASPERVSLAEGAPLGPSMQQLMEGEGSFSQQRAGTPPLNGAGQTQRSILPSQQFGGMVSKIDQTPHNQRNPPLQPAAPQGIPSQMPLPPIQSNFSGDLNGFGKGGKKAQILDSESLEKGQGVARLGPLSQTNQTSLGDIDPNQLQSRPINQPLPVGGTDAQIKPPRSNPSDASIRRDVPAPVQPTKPGVTERGPGKAPANKAAAPSIPAPPAPASGPTPAAEAKNPSQPSQRPQQTAANKTAAQPNPTRGPSPSSGAANNSVPATTSAKNVTGQQPTGHAPASNGTAAAPNRGPPPSSASASGVQPKVPNAGVANYGLPATAPVKPGTGQQPAGVGGKPGGTTNGPTSNAEQLANQALAKDQSQQGRVPGPQNDPNQANRPPVQSDKNPPNTASGPHGQAPTNKTATGAAGQNALGGSHGNPNGVPPGNNGPSKGNGGPISEKGALGGDNQATNSLNGFQSQENNFEQQRPLPYQSDSGDHAGFFPQSQGPQGRPPFEQIPPLSQEAQLQPPLPMEPYIPPKLEPGTPITPEYNFATTPLDESHKETVDGLPQAYAPLAAHTTQAEFMKRNMPSQQTTALLPASQERGPFPDSGYGSKVPSIAPSTQASNSQIGEDYPRQQNEGVNPKATKSSLGQAVIEALNDLTTQQTLQGASQIKLNDFMTHTISAIATANGVSRKDVQEQISDMYSKANAQQSAERPVNQTGDSRAGEELWKGATMKDPPRNLEASRRAAPEFKTNKGAQAAVEGFARENVERGANALGKKAFGRKLTIEEKRRILEHTMTVVNVAEYTPLRPGAMVARKALKGAVEAGLLPETEEEIKKGRVGRGKKKLGKT